MRRPVPRTAVWVALLLPPLLLVLCLIFAGLDLRQLPTGGITVERWRPLHEVAARHDILVGTAISYGAIRAGEGDNPFAELVRREFNSVTPANELKWEWTHPCPPLEIQSASYSTDPLLYNSDVAAWVENNRTTRRRLDPDNQYCNVDDPSDEWNWEEMDYIVRWAQRKGLGMYGVPLVWHMQNPEWLTLLTPYQAEWLMERHIREVVGRYCQPEFARPDGRSVVYAYDVVNEAINPEGALYGDSTRGESNPWFDIGEASLTGDNYVRRAFLYAKGALQEHCEGRGVKLFYNDHDFEYGGPWTDGVFDLVASLQQPRPGEPAALFPLVDGVGMQAHLRFYQADDPSEGAVNRYRYSDPPGIEAGALLIATMNRFSEALGVEIKVTELDVSLRRWRGHCAEDAPRPLHANGDCAIHDPDPRTFFDEQARFYAHVAEACVIASRCTGLTTWGVNDEASWLRPLQPLMYENCRLSGASATQSGLCPKPAYFAVHSAFSRDPSPP